MPGQRQPGPDHPHFAYSPIVERTAWRLPDDAALALCPIISLSYFEDYAPATGDQSAWLAGGVGFRSPPNIARLSAREYGHRVGIFRLLDLFERVGLPLTVAVDAMTAVRYPWLVRHCLERGAEIVAHGVSATQMPSNTLAEADERAAIVDTLAALRALGAQPRGWLGPEYGESERTPTLLAQVGLAYVADWCLDEQPLTMFNGLVALPLMADFDDAFALAYRGVAVHAYGRQLLRAFHQLCADGQRSSRVLAFLVRPFVIAQPSRIQVLEDALAEMAAEPPGRVWKTTPGDVVDWYQAHPWQPLGEAALTSPSPSPPPSPFDLHATR